MNEYTFVTSCKHKGTIKPVKSSGKHTGKWFCKVKGPKVDAEGIKVKTLYTAPFIGAAKASIAKFLGITVATVAVETTASVSQTQFTHTPTIQQKTASKIANEFDVGDDDEFAKFDLNAAVSSAKKQSPVKKPPPNPYRKQTQIDTPRISISNYKSSTPNVANDMRKELESLRGERDRLNKEICSARQETERIRQENERITKETSEAQNEKARLKGQVRAIREEHENLHSELKSAKQQKDKAAREKYETEVKELDDQKSKLKGQIRALQETYDELKSDIKVAAQKGENAKKAKHEKELKEFGVEKDKLKGQIRALQEEHDQLKNDVKSFTDKKNCAVREAETARIKKETYEKEAKTVKKALESHRVELESLAKKQKASPKAANEIEPPAKKRKTGRQSKIGTIVKSMKVQELKEEAVARGVEVKELARMNKDMILNMLVVGSQCIIKTEAWSEIVRVRKTFADERQKAAQLEMERQEELYRIEQQKRREEEKRRQEQKEKYRADEMRKQEELHYHSIPAKVHGCKVALTNSLLLHGSPRDYSVRCDVCNGYSAHYTCEKCNYDICGNCFKEKTMSAAEKKAEAKRKAAIQKEREEAAAERRRLQEEEEERYRKKWDPKTIFSEEIVNPSSKNKDPNGNAMQGFTVFCSDGYGYDGWHSYEGPPDKEFDTTYPTKKQANERARYLFVWKNPWGLEPDEVDMNNVIDENTKDGMISYETSPEDSTTWTVSVVPDAAFAYLDKATTRRHNHDTEYRSSSRNVYLPGFGF